MMRPLHIEHLIFYQLLGQAKFYEALPPTLSVLTEESQKAYQDALAVAMGKASCSGCTSIGGVLAPLMTKYGEQLAAIKEKEPALLDPLKSYIAYKRGYTPSEITMYYKGSDGRSRRLVL